MANEREDEDRIVSAFIPQNIREGVSLNGMNLDPMRTLEACIGALLGGALMAVIFHYLNIIFIISMTSEIAGIIVGAGLAAAIGYMGANNETFSKFIAHLIAFRKSRRIAYYNPRVKKLSPPNRSTEEAEADLLPRDKIRNWIEKYKQTSSEKNSEHIREIEEMHAAEGSLYFEDDIGQVEPPEAYMTKDEKKRKAKQDKMNAKREKREKKNSNKSRRRKR